MASALRHHRPAALVSARRRTRSGGTRSGATLCIAAVMLTGCIGAGKTSVGRAFGTMAATSPAAGEWIDMHKSTPSDTMVWLLSPNGDDALLSVHLSADGTREEQRKHFGRWTESRVTDGSGNSVPALCFVRRPGRDAPSCDRYTLDSARIDGALVRRLTVRGYAGEHHSGDRVLLVRLVRSRPRAATSPGENPTQQPTARAVDAASPAGSGGFHPRSVQPERPSVATHAGTVAAGYLELETGIERDRAADGSHAAQLPTIFKFGMTKHMQLALSIPTSSATGVSFGAGDVAIGLKWRIKEDGALLQDIALLPQVKFSSGGARGTGTTDFSLLLINSRTIGAVGLDLNVGGTWRSGDGTQAPRSSTMWTMAAGIPVHGAWGWALECYGYPRTAGPAGAASIVALLTGPTYVLRPELALDLGVIEPITGAQPRGFYVGIVTSLGQLISR